MVLYDSFYSLHHVILHERYIASRYCWIKWPVDPMVEKPQIAILINGLWAKYHCGRVAENQIWVFGIVDTSYTPSRGYVEIVERRNAATLFPIIQSVCLDGSIIHSDEWKDYLKIQSELGFQHHTVNHSKRFVAPVGTHTQNIESYWNRIKQLIKRMNGCHRDFLHWYLQELMYRERFNEGNFFLNFVEHISLFYRV